MTYRQILTFCDFRERAEARAEHYREQGYANVTVHFDSFTGRWRIEADA